MAWQSLAPDGNQSVKANVTILQDNTSYIEATMGNSSNTSKDHFWNIGTDEDGHHRAVQMQNYADTYVGAPVSPSLATGMDLALFGLLNGSAVEPMARNSSGVMQLLGIRAYVVWDLVNGPDPTNQTILNSFNVTSVALQSNARVAITFSTALPSDNYAVFVGGMSSSGNSSFNILNASVPSGLSANARKNSLSCLAIFRDGSNNAVNPLQGWFVAFGG